ncbi:MAG: oxygen-independent coproporphyrinogen III oxidase [Clostridia bacterium]|nr:radical SAM family heme chaperone HemW [Lachnospiraceae bacterium]NCC00139.1 oxygen-independent coproporphyrinogen III oxidase [Clostridia bacterium]NCD01599.1 oxygen-independent coproporphyrinogen III oxidase [Clostridia bacterium]
MKREPLEIYIHIPFCVKKCNYCDFLSYGIEDKSLENTACQSNRQNPVPQSYVDVLCREIRWYGSMDGIKHRPVRSVFFGGGTPSLLSEDQMLQLMSELRTDFLIARGAEISMEANPGTLTPAKLERMHALGINRLSIGLQSTSEDELKILGRIHSYGAFLQSFKWARAAGFDNINVDIITAVPGQTVDSYRKTLDQVLALSPEHISAYSLIIEPGTPFEEMDAKGELELPDEDEERKMYEITGTFLKKNGYERYEISNYSKPEQECRHNIGYWERMDYLGLGLGAASLIGKKRFTNPKNMTVYMKGSFAQESWYSDEELLDEKAAIEEFMFLGLRMIQGVSEKAFYKEFGRKIMAVYGSIIQDNCNKGLLKRKNGRIFLTSKGLDLANTVMADFL